MRGHQVPAGERGSGQGRRGPGLKDLGRVPKVKRPERMEEESGRD